MKKILILAYDFPPYISVGGLRPYGWYKNLSEFGIYPIVVTRQWENKKGNKLDYILPSKSDYKIIDHNKEGTIIKAPFKPNISNKLLLKYGEKRFKFIRKLISAYYEFIQYIFIIGPKAQIYKEANNFLKEEQVDVIIATGDPFVLFSYANKLSKKHNIPWIADYRDPWSQDIPIQKYKLYQKWCSFFEKKIIPQAKTITTVSEFLKIKIMELTKINNAYIIYNGYDEDLVKMTSHLSQNKDKMSVAYMGTIYDWYPINNFFMVVLKFIEEYEPNNFEINFYGINKEVELKELINTRYKKLEGFINIYPKMQNSELLKKIATDNLFLLFNNYSFLGTKIFDYVALKRKILFCYTDDFESKRLKKQHYLIEELGSEFQHLQEDMLKSTNSAIIIKDELHLNDVLKELYKEFSKKRTISCDAVNTEMYSRKIQTQELAKIILNIV
ncbi:glycosyltransferase family 4 protein [Vicingus serpentipes]|uniref:Glycosyltransferase family 4 protein n=1 Tax=Vicingus serpentipes TaxID=1926625 RepID=A0A5C6S0Z0_9FLAO|nr:glycosyltransferase [Vicingus serpentipes]TXB67272.1 glycosyltransferase family 4 protein [Vicingus serpentipes]